jgi:hypothetical protein
VCHLNDSVLDYGLPLTEADRRWRALPGKTGLLYLYPVATTATVPESVTLIILPYIYSAPSTAITFVTSSELTAPHRLKLLPTVLHHETHLPIHMRLLENVFFSPGGLGGLNNLHTASLFAAAAICGSCLQEEILSISLRRLRSNSA